MSTPFRTRSPLAPAPEYVPRRPEETVLFGIVRDHLEDFLTYARETYGSGLPGYVEQAFRAYLTCGVFAHGFLRFHCDDCRRDLLVAFACKGRGVCPSCGARRMCNSAAHLVDRVLPAAPVRQWVLSLPFELRRLAAFRADVARALGRIFIDVVAAEQRRAAGLAGSQIGAVNHLQRFGGSLNLNLHYHAIIVDGVFVPDDGGRVRFRETAAPSREMLDRIIHRVRDRALRWLRKNGAFDERPPEERSNESAESAALDRCADVALRGGAFKRLGRDGGAQGGDEGDARFEPRRRGPFVAEVDGFNVHAAVRIEAHDDQGRERLVRYCARPCFALERLTRLRDGRQQIVSRSAETRFFREEDPPRSQTIRLRSKPARLRARTTDRRAERCAPLPGKTLFFSKKGSAPSLPGRLRAGRLVFVRRRRGGARPSSFLLRGRPGFSRRRSSSIAADSFLFEATLSAFADDTFFSRGRSSAPGDEPSSIGDDPSPCEGESFAWIRPGSPSRVLLCVPGGSPGPVPRRSPRRPAAFGRAASSSAREAWGAQTLPRIPGDDQANVPLPG